MKAGWWYSALLLVLALTVGVIVPAIARWAARKQMRRELDALARRADADQ
jgi:hypothetical protein